MKFTAVVQAVILGSSIVSIEARLEGNSELAEFGASSMSMNQLAAYGGEVEFGAVPAMEMVFTPPTTSKATKMPGAGKSGKGTAPSVTLASGKTGKASYPSAAPSVSSAPSVVSCSIQNLIGKSISGTSNLWVQNSNTWSIAGFNLIFSQPPAVTATTGVGVVVGKWCGPNFNVSVVAAQTGFSEPGNIVSFAMAQTDTCPNANNPCKTYNGEYNCGTGEVIIGNAQISGNARFHVGSVNSASLSCPYNV